MAWEMSAIWMIGALLLSVAAGYGFFKLNKVMGMILGLVALLVVFAAIFGLLGISVLAFAASGVIAAVGFGYLAGTGLSMFL